MVKKNVFLILLATGLMAGSMTANAGLIPVWTGQWSNGGIAADFGLTFDSQTPAGAFSGYFDWTCTAGVTCSGREFFSGTLTGSTLSFSTTSIAPGAVNIVPASYWGTLVDPKTITGSDSSNSHWTAHAVPEPATLGLLGLGLTGFGLIRRRRIA